ncbi:MAG: ABC transporter ATP-binding protein [Oscillospiraceae bacterium]|nr:ABC transporter ATP-binding protein [Candidatus Limimonas egerieequi]
MIELINYSKDFKKRTVLNNINYSFNDGTVYGIYGTNGSGKTMLLRAVAGLIVPTSGTVKIDNVELHKDISFPQGLGIVIENMRLLPNYNAFDNLKILSEIRKVATDSDISDSLERVGLNSDLKVKKYSLGMKQRLNIAQAIFEHPKIILLDEPTNALDTAGVKLVYNIIHDEKEKGATIILTTHHKEDLESVCDIILKMEEGNLYEE